MKETVPCDIGIKFLPHFPTVLIGAGEGEESNLITVAMVHVFSMDPPMVGIGIAPERHSYRLLEDHPEFTVNVPSPDLIPELLDCGRESGSDIDKFEEFDLTKEKSKNISVVGVEECPLILECGIEEEKKVGDHKWFFGEVLNAKKSEDFDREETVLYWGGEFRKPGELLKTR